MAEPYRTRSTAIPESMGRAHVWRGILLHYWIAYGARCWRRGRSRRRWTQLQGGSLYRPAHRDLGPLLALCRLGLDVCRAAGLPVEHEALSRARRSQGVLR